MTTIELNSVLSNVNVETLMKDTTVFQVHDTTKHIKYNVNIKTLTAAIAKQLMCDGIIPAQGD